MRTMNRFFVAFEAFTSIHIEILQQVAEEDKVVTYLVTQGEHTGEFFGLPATGRTATLYSMRIDRLRDDKIVEHWSVADMAGFLQQLQA